MLLFTGTLATIPSSLPVEIPRHLIHIMFMPSCFLLSRCFALPIMVMGGLAEAFRVDHRAMPPLVCYTSRDSPFAHDMPDIERQHWEEHVPQAVMTRQGWYV
jgi:hypothetical protein